MEGSRAKQRKRICRQWASFPVKRVSERYMGESVLQLWQTGTFCQRLPGAICSGGRKARNSTLREVMGGGEAGRAEMGRTDTVKREVLSSSQNVKAVLPQPTDQPFHDHKPGDWVLIRDLRRRRWNQPKWTGPHQVLLVTHTAVKVPGRGTRVHHTHCKNAPTSPEETTTLRVPQKDENVNETLSHHVQARYQLLQITKGSKPDEVDKDLGLEHLFDEDNL
ncbi:uncharacterized protein [Hoplias malabaricus]|uniref:uncharacterized protein isoform X2 n=1 Tax=Hoplias malabaricus TaxID=27720 RepID=UPI003461CB31